MKLGKLFRLKFSFYHFQQVEPARQNFDPVRYFPLIYIENQILFYIHNNHSFSLRLQISYQIDEVFFRGALFYLLYFFDVARVEVLVEWGGGGGGQDLGSDDGDGLSG